MSEPRIRPAEEADVPVVAGIVEHPCRHYIARMGQPPGPMLDNYAVLVAERNVRLHAEAPRCVLSRSAPLLFSSPVSCYTRTRMTRCIASSPARHSSKRGNTTSSAAGYNAE